MQSVKNIHVIFGLLLVLFSSAALAKHLSEVQTTAQPGTVSLTFDDGPSPIYTPQILDILKKNDIKATFFVVGPLAKQFPKLIERMVVEGHAVAIHAMTHARLTMLNDGQLNHEVVGSRDLMHKLIGKSPVCLRPPYGAKNKHVEAYVKAHELILVSNGFNSLDYKKQSVEKLAQWVIENAHSGQVILMHDGYSKRQKTVDALPKIIAGIREKGLKFSTICYPQD